MLRDRGLSALTVFDQAMAGVSDSTLWDTVQFEGRVLITADVAFADTRRHTPGTHAGVVLLRLEKESRRGCIELVRKLLGTLHPLSGRSGAVVVVRERGIRVRRP